MRSSGGFAGESGVLFMDMTAEIRRRRLVSKESISSIARDLKLSRPTVRKHCRTQSEPIYQRHKQPTPTLGGFQETLETWLQAAQSAAPERASVVRWLASRGILRRLQQSLQRPIELC